MLITKSRHSLLFVGVSRWLQSLHLTCSGSYQQKVDVNSSFHNNLSSMSKLAYCSAHSCLIILSLLTVTYDIQEYLVIYLATSTCSMAYCYTRVILRCLWKLNKLDAGMPGGEPRGLSRTQLTGVTGPSSDTGVYEVSSAKAEPGPKSTKFIHGVIAAHRRSDPPILFGMPVQKMCLILPIRPQNWLPWQRPSIANCRHVGRYFLRGP